ncbi:MAG: hypothetical protein ABSC72_11720 [Methylovirgula sp.]|jgi:hypothetical protein
MADTIEIDLASLKGFSEERRDFLPHTLQGCVLEISISPKILAALRAIEFGTVDGIVGPSELGATSLASK